MATMVVGLVSIPAAHADTPAMTVTPATGITDPQEVVVQISGFTPDPFASLQIAECGNAYANLDPLPAPPTVTPGVLDSKDCEEIGFLSQGTLTSSPATVAGLTTGSNPTVHQTGIGTGDRACITADGVPPCFIYVSTSVNLPPFPLTDIEFANAMPTGSAPAATTTTVTPIGSPVAIGKIAHALVQVSTADPTLTPDGTVQVFADGGATPVGTGDLGTDATVSVPIGSPTLGDHTLTASYVGNGSFAGSASTTPSALSITGVNNVSIGDASIVEGNSLVLRTLVFPVVLSTLPTTPVLVNYAVVAAGTNPASIGTVKTPGAQVIAQAKTLVFKPGPATVKYIAVKVFGDTLNLGDKTFAVQLTMNPLDTSGYVIRRGTGNGLIIDDDNPTVLSPVVSIGSSSVPEGDFGGPKALKFAVTLSSPSSATITVPIQVSSGTAVHGTKVTGDWAGAINRKLVFRPGQVSKIIAVSIFPDTVSELDKTVNVKLLPLVTTDGTAALGPQFQAVGTILSDE